MLRQLIATDIPALVDIEAATQFSPWTEDIFQKCVILGSQGWVVEVAGRVVGFVLLFAKVGEGHILNIGVHPDFQRQGYGRRLMTQVMTAAESAALNIVFLEVRVSNIAAITLYQSLGFQQLSRRKNYYATAAGREDALILAKMLT